MSETIAYSIRPLQEKDNTIIASIIRSVLAEFKANRPGTVYYDPTTDDLYSLFCEKNAAYFIAEMNNEIVGGAGVFPTPALPQGCCELVKLYLLPQARGTGLGKKLMLTCFETATQLGYTSVYLETMPELNNAIDLYKRLGFKDLPGPLGNSGHFGCDIWMLKAL